MRALAALAQRPPPTASPTGSLKPPQATIAAALVANPADYYVNVHNTPFPAGAVRGQLAKADLQGT